MTTPNHPPTPPELDKEVRKVILARAMATNAKLLARFATASDDLDRGNHRGALGAIDGAERDIQTLRVTLLLLP
ncbi:MAG TPA: hypothetical protein VNJ52_14585 [Patescibacteria group bacterium]|nr:hypothetical protein [Patescibacteria group bacterium]